jgi:hypothetical protein
MVGNSKGKVPLRRSRLIQSVSRGKINTMGGHSIGHSRQKVYMYICSIPNGFRESYFTVQYCTVYCTDKQYAMSSHELQSTLMLTVEFSKMYYTR